MNKIVVVKPTDVECLVCDAKSGEWCKTKGVRRSVPHRNRITSARRRREAVNKQNPTTA